MRRSPINRCASKVDPNWAAESPQGLDRESAQRKKIFRKISGRDDGICTCDTYVPNASKEGSNLGGRLLDRTICRAYANVDWAENMQ